MSTNFDAVFPSNVIAEIITEIESDSAFGTSDGVSVVVRRALEPDDANRSMGVFADEWMPIDYEMRGGAGNHPTRAAYTYKIDLLVKGIDRETVESEHGHLAKYVRAMLFRSEALRLRLAALQETSFGATERFQRMKVMRQQYGASENSGIFFRVSSTTLVVETESQ